ncbi:MAG: hypothetical protein ACYC9O_02215 [Candidatus Latescibacterota bacterium]
MNFTDENRWSGQKLLTLSILLGLMLGSFSGIFIVSPALNFCLRLLMGSTFGLISGLAAGVILADRTASKDSIS